MSHLTDPLLTMQTFLPMVQTRYLQSKTFYSWHKYITYNLNHFTHNDVTHNPNPFSHNTHVPYDQNSFTHSTDMLLIFQALLGVSQTCFL